MAKIATREAYGKALQEIVSENKDIVVLDADLSGATKTSYVRENSPSQFFNCGIAEANMVSISAGLAASGLKPFVSSFAMFLAGRAYEQVRNSIGYPHLNVKLCATHGGISVGEDGATHQCNEDIGLMRTIPGMTVLQPCDENETHAMIKYLADYAGPCYVRLSRLAVEPVNTGSYKFKIGEIVPIIEGKSIAIFATGIMVGIAKEAIEILKTEGISVALYNIHTIKPLNVDTLKELSKQYKYFIIAEEHSKIGGLYSAICEEIGNEIAIKSVAINDTFGESGTPERLFKKYGIDSQAIIKTIKSIL